MKISTILRKKLMNGENVEARISRKEKFQFRDEEGWVSDGELAYERE